MLCWHPTTSLTHTGSGGEGGDTDDEGGDESDDYTPVRRTPSVPLPDGAQLPRLARVGEVVVVSAVAGELLATAAAHNQRIMARLSSEATPAGSAERWEPTTTQLLEQLRGQVRMVLLNISLQVSDTDTARSMSIPFHRLCGLLSAHV